MGKGIKSRVKSYIYWHFNYDRVAERKIKKSIRLWHKNSPFSKMRATLMWYRLQKKYTTSYRPSITVGENLRIEHCMGTRIGETTIIGDNVRIYQNVQLIAKVVGDQKLLDNKERRHPKIGNNVILSACCMVIGPVTIGDNCIIGANAMVTHDVPPNSVVVGLNQIKPRRSDQVAPRFKASAHDNNTTRYID